MQKLWGSCLLALWLAVCGSIWAGESVDVTSVRFDGQRLQGNPNEWIECAITLRPSQSSEPAEDIQVELILNYRTPRGEYTYKGECQLYILERTSVVRFYLPGDVVKSYSLTRNPQHYLINIKSAKGKEPYVSQMGSPMMLNTDRRAKLETEAARLPDSRNLLPHYNTPFYSLSQNWRDLPSYVID